MAPVQPDRSRDWSARARAGAVAALVVAVFAAWWNSFGNPFLFDDQSAIVRNASIRSFATALHPPVDAAGVPNRPLVNLSLALNHAIGGTSVRGYHLFNTALHALNAVLLFALLRRVFGRAAGEHEHGDEPKVERGLRTRSASAAVSSASSAAPTSLAAASQRKRTSPEASFHPGTSAASQRTRTSPEASFHPAASAASLHPGLPLAAPDLLALLTSLLWAVHPLQTESVTFVIQRTELLGGFFILLALVCWARALEGQCHQTGDTRASARESDCHQTGDTRTSVGESQCHQTGDTLVFARGWGLAAVGAAAVGGFAKEIVAVVPLLALLYDRTSVAGTFAGAWRARWRWYLALGSAWLVIGGFMLRTPERGGIVGFGLGVSAWEYLLTQCHALVLYLKLSLWPHPLVVDYGTIVIRSPAEVWWQGCVVLALLGGTAWALVRRPGWGFVGAWFFVILAPSSSVVPLVTQTIAEHRMYLPLAAVLIVLVAAVARLRRTGAIAGVLVIAAAACLVLTVRRNRDYANPLALWRQTAERAPGNYRAHYNVANALVAARRPGEAIASYQRAAQLKREQGSIHYNLGATLLALGRIPEAIGALESALRLGPDTVDVRANLGAALAQLGRTDDAIAHYARAAELDPRASDLRETLGLLRLAQGDRSGALREFEAAASLQPDSAALRQRVDRLRRELGR